MPQVATLICKLLRALQTTLVALLRIPGCLTQATQSKRSAEPWPSSAASLWAVPLMYRRALEWSSRPAPCRLSTRRDDAPHGAANLRVVVDATTLGNRQRVNPVLDSVSHSKQFTSSYPSHKWEGYKLPSPQFTLFLGVLSFVRALSSLSDWYELCYYVRVRAIPS